MGARASPVHTISVCLWPVLRPVRRITGLFWSMAYTEEQKSAALASLDANGGNVKKTARLTGIPITTLRDWRDGEHVSATVAEKRTEKKADLADLYEQVTRDILGSISRDDIAKSNLSSRLTGAAIATDKMQLLREKPTSINAQYDSPEARMERLSAIFDRAGSRRSGTAPELGTEQPTVH